MDDNHSSLIKDGISMLNLQGIEICDSPGKGRGIFAKKDFEGGDIILDEVPLISCQFAWNQDYGYSACDHCMRSLESPEQNVRRLCQDNSLNLPYSKELFPPINCIRCRCGVLYCSDECKTNARLSYHEALCFMPDGDKAVHIKCIRDIWKNMHYPPETATVMLILRIYACIHQAENKAAAIRTFQEFSCLTSDESGKKCHRIVKEELVGVLREALINCVMQMEWDIPSSCTSPESFLGILCLIATNGQGIGTSAFSDWVNKIEEMTYQSDAESKELDKLIERLHERLEEVVGLDFLNNEGSGLYRIQSKINHSCLPNVEVIFPFGNYRLQLRATQSISAGDEVCTSYIDECMLQRSRHSRQKYLGENYVFTCVCPLCEKQATDPDVTSDEEDDDDDEDNEIIVD